MKETANGGECALYQPESHHDIPRSPVVPVWTLLEFRVVHRTLTMTLDMAILSGRIVLWNSKTAQPPAHSASTVRGPRHP